MADPTATITRDFKTDVDRHEGVIKNAEALKIGGLLGSDYLTGLTEFIDDTKNIIPLGIAVKQAEGDNENLTGNVAGDYSVIARAGVVLENVSVTGVAAITDMWKLVYATDGQTFTLTAPTTALPIGFIKKWNATTYCNVQLFSIAEALTWSFIPVKETINLGTVHGNAFQDNGAHDLLYFTCRRHMKITDFYAYCVGYDNALIAGNQDVNLEIGATNLTGGLLNMALADGDAAADLGVKITSTAITALNIAQRGEIVTAEIVAGGTGFTADTATAFALFMDVEYLPGA